VAIQSSRKKSERNSARSEKRQKLTEVQSSQPDDAPEYQTEEYLDHSVDHLARVSAARSAAQRQIESFGDVSEYDRTTLRGRLKDAPDSGLQHWLNFPKVGPGESREER
jgi:hypothetical protein